MCVVEFLLINVFWGYFVSVVVHAIFPPFPELALSPPLSLPLPRSPSILFFRVLSPTLPLPFLVSWDCPPQLLTTSLNLISSG